MMVLTKSLLFFLFIIHYCYGSKDCTISDILLRRFEKGHYTFYSGQRLQKANSSISSPTNYYVVTVLAYYSNCLGFTTEALDTVILDCPQEYAEKIGCFKILTAKFNPQNNTAFFAEKENRTCASKLNEFCIGLKIQDNITITLDCDYYTEGAYYMPYGVAQVGSANTGQFTGPLNSGPPGARGYPKK
ncbi:uncharacterized protein LOC108905679 [Anoplophora glabripennis]|uniref:uncharacterized protein LOC108905679 n=1 Tax=Anoplophora glabripennis TaxID=217634 RepID=UPI000873F3DF|nr:uncharacterized protein LOC108905679 [Anoplophora glabripennis]